MFEYLFNLTSKYLDIHMLLEKCCHNLFLVKYKILAHHFVVCNYYRSLQQHPNVFLNSHTHIAIIMFVMTMAYIEYSLCSDICSLFLYLIWRRLLHHVTSFLYLYNIECMVKLMQAGRKL